MVDKKERLFCINLCCDGTNEQVEKVLVKIRQMINYKSVEAIEIDEL